MISLITFPLDTVPQVQEKILLYVDSLRTICLETDPVRVRASDAVTPKKGPGKRIMKGCILMAGKNFEKDEPAPRVALGLKVPGKNVDGKSEHTPGFVDEKKPKPITYKRGGRPLVAELPPYNPDKVPRNSLIERLKERIAQTEEEP